MERAHPSGGYPPLPPDADEGDDGNDTPPPPERRGRYQRVEDRRPIVAPVSPPTVVSLVGSVIDHKLFVLAASVLAYFGGRVTGPGERMKAIETELVAARLRDSLSLEDRREQRAAIVTFATMIGRAVCAKLTPQDAAASGIPCRLLQDGSLWPLFRTSLAAPMTPRSVRVAVVAPFRPYVPPPAVLWLLPAVTTRPTSLPATRVPRPRA